MTQRKFLYVDAAGLYIETAGAYESSDFISTSAGAGDAGKPIVLDAGGHVDASMINDADIDHGSIGGLGDDDHTQYILAAGTRAFSGDQSMGSNQLTSVGDPTASGIDAASDDAIPMSFLASTSASEGASRIGVQDAAGYFVANNVESALAELYNAITVQGVSYTVGVGGVTKGDAVYVDANNTVKVFSTLTSSKRVMGLAFTTQVATESVVVAANDVVITGAIAAATAGDVYYWNGTALSTTAPAGAGSYVWEAGTAKNATDLHVDVRFIKKNA